MTGNDLIAKHHLSPIAAWILLDVLNAMQPAEEMGGPDGADYVGLMTAISEEAANRAEIAKAGK